MTLAELEALPTACDLVQAADALGIGKTLAYTLNERNEFPIATHRIGSRIVVATAELRRFLGVEQAVDASLVDEVRRTNDLLAQLVALLKIATVAQVAS